MFSMFSFVLELDHSSRSKHDYECDGRLVIEEEDESEAIGHHTLSSAVARS
jgi:hypothetical protein